MKASGVLMNVVRNLPAAAMEAQGTHLIGSISGLLNEFSDSVHVVRDVSQGQQLLVDTFNLDKKIRQLLG